MSRFSKSAAFPILIVVILAFFAQQLISSPNKEKDPGFNTFLTQLENNQIKTVEMRNRSNELLVTKTDKKQYEIGFATEYGDELTETLLAAEKDNKIASFDIKGTRTNGWISMLTYVLPFLLFIGFWIFLMNQMQGGGSKVMSFGKSRAKRMSVDSPKITFRDVAGADEAQRLEHPERLERRTR
ncbi:MAG: ATP-dependent metallopeptidase FtsH/Yme1/Tma family protein, partial [Actinobacteria bacterium]|nr:ATP-dependent metallopeptidase FtsH/Yme1/Tma family protein [Actinomycetota bacterium]